MRGDAERELRRLIDAVEARGTGWSPGEGADDEELDRLRQHFAPWVVPDELVEVLSVMNGSDGEDVTVDQTGPLLSCEEIVDETGLLKELLGEMDDEGLFPWNRAWIVVTSAAQTYGALVGATEPRERSCVADLSFGNQYYPIIAGSLTALLAASADAWEQGLHPTQTWSNEDPGPYGEAYPRLRALVTRREQQYPGPNGLVQADGVSFDARAWPGEWPRPGAPSRPLDQVVPLLRAIERPGIDARVQVAVDHRIDRYVRVSDGGTACWLDLPPGFETNRRVTDGANLDALVHVDHPDSAPARPAEIAGLPGPVLRVIGVL